MRSGHLVQKTEVQEQPRSNDMKGKSREVNTELTRATRTPFMTRSRSLAPCLATWQGLTAYYLELVEQPLG
jgi:hypothetical protein